MGLRKCEIMQQCKYLAEETIKEVLNKPCIVKWAYICHNKDIYTDSDEKKTKNIKLVL